MKFGIVSASVAAAVILWVMDGRAQQVSSPSSGGLTGHEVISKHQRIDQQGVASATGTCTAGKKIFGGGAKFSPDPHFADAIVYSYPDKSGWSAEVKRGDGAKTAGFLDVFAICANAQ